MWYAEGMKISDAVELAEALMAQHGVSSNWKFRLNSKRRTLGLTNHTFRTLELSRYLIELNDEDEVRDVVLHEIAHIFAGANAGHGPLWKAHAARLGARPQTYNTTAQLSSGRWKGYCPHGKNVVEKYRRPRSRYHVCRCNDLTMRDALVWVDVETGDGFTANPHVDRREAAISAAKAANPGLRLSVTVV